MRSLDPESTNMEANMSEKKLTVVALFYGRKGMAKGLKDELMKLISPTRKEDGCIEYRLHQCSNIPENFMFYENWLSKEHLDAHLKTPHLMSLGPKIEKFLAEPVKVTFLEELD